MNPSADLHVHTTASDGRYTPSEAVFEAIRAGLSAIALADHDTMAGLPEAIEAGSRAGIIVVPGVEINTDHEGAEFHVLGYCACAQDVTLSRLLLTLREARRERLGQILERLRRMGMEISQTRVLEFAGKAAPGRPHVAMAMQQAGFVNSIREAFDRYLGLGKPAYVARCRVTPCEAIRVIRGAGGVAVLAHPGLTSFESMMPGLVACGLRGLEAHHPDHGPDEVQKVLGIARRYGLLVTGGSDSHGPKETGRAAIGEVTVPFSVVEELRREALSLRA